jgi:hypothetical protein
MRSIQSHLFTILCALSALSLLAFPITSQAQLVFGGRVLMTFPCTCEPGEAWIVAVGIPRPGGFVFRIGATMLYSFYSPTVPAWQLGRAILPGTCLMYVPPYECVDDEVPGGTMYMDGTSGF